MKTTIDGVSMDDGLFIPSQPLSLNNRLIVEIYKKEALKTTEKNGFAFISQKLALRGLKVLIDAKLNDGTYIKKHSMVYIKEEVLHTAAWAQKALECVGIEGQFLVVDISNVEFIVPWL